MPDPGCSSPGSRVPVVGLVWGVVVGVEMGAGVIVNVRNGDEGTVGTGAAVGDASSELEEQAHTPITDTIKHHNRSRARGNVGQGGKKDNFRKLACTGSSGNEYRRSFSVSCH